MFTRKIIALTAGAVLAAGGIAGAVTANAETAAGACQVTGSVNSVSGMDLTPSTDDFTFKSVTITCTGSDADDNGSWNVQAAGSATNNTCAGGPFSGTITGGSGPEGSLTAGTTFTGVREGTSVQVEGTIAAGGDTHTFAAHLIFVPTDGVCDPASGDTTGATHNATINQGSTAVVTES